MKTRTWLRAAKLGALCGLMLPGAMAAQGPEYADAETRETVERMLAAHGGMGPWLASKTVAYNHVMYAPMEGWSPWWVSREVVEQGRRRVYHDWPLDNAILGHDGERSWTVNWNKPNQPGPMARVHYYFIFLPWLSQDPTVNLKTVGRETLPEDDKESIAVEMSFDDAGGNPPFFLFIDPYTDQLRGFGYSVVRHRIDTFGKVNGLVFPSEWQTYRPDGSIMGHHTALNVEFDVPWDESRMAPPEKAVVEQGGQ